MAVWPGWGSSKGQKGQHWKWSGRGRGAALRAPDLDTASLPRPCLLLMWRAFSTISFYPSGWRGRRSVRAGGATFLGPQHHMTPGPRPSQKCWLLLPAESWHQPVLPGEAPGRLCGHACAPVSSAPRMPSAELGWAGLCAQHPQHPQHPGAQVSLCFPVSLAVPDCFQCDECPGTAAVVFGERCMCRRHSALPFISQEGSLPLFAEGNGSSLEGAPLPTGSGLWGEISRTIISSALDES